MAQGVVNSGQPVEVLTAVQPNTSEVSSSYDPYVVRSLPNASRSPDTCAETSQAQDRQEGPVGRGCGGQ